MGKTNICRDEERGNTQARPCSMWERENTGDKRKNNIQQHFPNLA